MSTAPPEIEREGAKSIVMYASAVSPGHRSVRQIVMRALLLLAALSVALLLVGSYEVRGSLYVCANCGRYMDVSQRGFTAPSGSLGYIAIWSRPTVSNSDLSAYLDPNGGCAHAWVYSGAQGCGFFHRWCGVPMRRADLWRRGDTEFDAFVRNKFATDPQFVANVRRVLASREDAGRFVMDAFVEDDESK